MHIQLPDNVVASAQQLASQAGFPDVEQYLAHLIDCAQENLHYHRDIEQKLLEGLESAASPVTEGDWSALKARIPGNSNH